MTRNGFSTAIAKIKFTENQELIEKGEHSRERDPGLKRVSYILSSSCQSVVSFQLLKNAISGNHVFCFVNTHVKERFCCHWH